MMFIHSFILETYIAPLSVVTGTGVHTPEAPPLSDVGPQDGLQVFDVVAMMTQSTLGNPDILSLLLVVMFIRSKKKSKSCKMKKLWF